MAEGVEDFEKAKAILKKQNKDGDSLYDHLTQVLLKIIKNRPDDALGAFESICSSTKTVGLSVGEEPTEMEMGEAKAAVLAAYMTTAQLIQPGFGKVKNTGDEGDEDEEEDEEEEKENVPIPDILDLAEVVEWGGLSLGQEETYKVQLSMQQLANSQEGLVNIRFFGKILGTEQDYFIVEAAMEEWPEEGEEEEEDENPNREAMGTGVNAFTYFVSNSPGAPWTQLPALKPIHLLKAKQMRRSFTGILTTPVLGFPRFPWGEALYLRAQIARIVASTTVVPKGFYSMDPDDEEAEPADNEEFIPIPAQFLNEPTMWVHQRPFILNTEGRTTNFGNDEEEEEEDEGDEGDKKEKPIKEKAPPRLSALDQDKGDLSALWSFRVVPSALDQNAIAVARSVAWPGSITVARGKVFTTFYVGWGQKQLAAPYRPPAPPQPQLEYDIVDPVAAVAKLTEQADTLPPPGTVIKQPPPDNEDEGDSDDNEEEERPDEGDE